jgi:hypothetical protein
MKRKRERRKKGYIVLLLAFCRRERWKNGYIALFLASCKRKNGYLALLLTSCRRGATEGSNLSVNKY